MIEDQKCKKIIGTFYEKEWQKNQSKVTAEKLVKKKVINSSLDLKYTRFYSIIRLIKTNCITRILISQYFVKQWSHFGGNEKVELDLSKCVSKSDEKSVLTNLNNLMSEVDK